MKYKQMDPSWREILSKEFKKEYFQTLIAFLEKERKKKKIFPKEEDVFAAFTSLPFDKVRVVILGQDPYHTEGMAVGKAFAVPIGSKTPPSLRNIYKEIKSDLNKDPGFFGDLPSQGVLLLNTVFTVEEGAPLSHRNKGWERFSKAVLEALWASEKKIVFLLWGASAKKKGKELFKGDMGHLVLTAGHPSPLSARYFLGCRHFSKANAFLKEERGETVDWCKR